MRKGTIRFHGSLNDFLRPEQRRQVFTLPGGRRASVKDVIESFNVPHPEVELIRVDGRAVDFGYLVEAATAIEVYPAERAQDLDDGPALRPPLPEPPRFVIDSNLGRLARYLRLLGFDALYSNRYSDQAVARLAADQERVVLTRDRFLLRHRIITWGCFVRAVEPARQLQEIVSRLDLQGRVRPFSRCTLCNARLEEIDKAEILERLEPKTIRHFQRFKHCPGCDRIYWPGSHYQRALQLVERVAG